VARRLRTLIDFEPNVFDLGRGLRFVFRGHENPLPGLFDPSRRPVKVRPSYALWDGRDVVQEVSRGVELVRQAVEPVQGRYQAF